MDGVLEPDTLEVKIDVTPKTVVLFPEVVVADIPECTMLALAEGFDDAALATEDGVLWVTLDLGSAACSGKGGGASIVSSL
jgi:hypothetical protein